MNFRQSATNFRHTVSGSSELVRFGVDPSLAGLYFRLRERCPTPVSALSPSEERSLHALEEAGLIDVFTGIVTVVDPLLATRRRFGGRPELIRRRRTRHQTLELIRYAEDLVLFLNGEIQFHTREEKESHEAMITAPLCFSGRAERVLILGGGDGLAAREALRFPDVELIRVVELDAEMIKMAREEPEVRRLNGDAFHHPKVEVIVGDAIEHALKTDERFDVVVDDCEFTITNQPDANTRQKYIDYLRALPDRLRPGGIGSIMTPLCPESREELRALTAELDRFVPGLFAKARACPDLRSACLLSTSARCAHAGDCEFQSFYLDAEVYDYFANDPYPDIQRWPKDPGPSLEAIVRGLAESRGRASVESVEP